MEYPRIGNIQLDGFALLAPMAGVSDLAYRVIARKMGAALTTAEMVSAKGLYYHNEKTKDMLKIAEEEHPVSLQLFGSDPAVMALGAKVMEKAGADIVDINMGCPMQKVVKNGDGSALMKNVTLAAEIISAVTAAVKIPVTVKMRLGWSRDTINAVELAMAAESAGGGAITGPGWARHSQPLRSMVGHGKIFIWERQTGEKSKRLWMPSVFLLSETGMWGTALRQRH